MPAVIKSAENRSVCLIGACMMGSCGTIRIGEYQIEAGGRKIRKFKSILDKLEIPHVLDDVGFHNTLMDLHRMKSLYHTEVWKVEKDGSVSLKNRFGHSGRFQHRSLAVNSLFEFRFVDLSLLSSREAEFLSNLIYQFEFASHLYASAYH
jgi:hypothetical protein